MAFTTLAIDPAWKTHSNTRTNLVQVSSYCPDRPYVELRIPESVQNVKQVHFSVLSHDQGT